MKREKVFKRLLLIASAAVLVLPLVSFLLIYPLFAGFVHQEAIKDSVEFADHFISLFFHERQEIDRALITPVFEKTLNLHKKDFETEKIKVFSPSGEVVYSTDPKDIVRYWQYQQTRLFS